MDMSDCVQGDLLMESWLACLAGEGHRVSGARAATGLIRSRNGRRGRYRWLLWVSEGPIRVFGRGERAEIRLHLSQARRHGEALYLVVGFTPEPKRIVVVPAAGVLRVGQVRSDKGGIAWDD